MGRREIFGRVAASTARVALRRARFGPRQPQWSFRYEVVVDYFRTQFQEEAPLDVVRKRIDAPGKLEAQRARLAFQPETIADCPCEWSVADCPCEWSVPKSRDDRVILYFHGGGYAFGSFRSHRSMGVELALRTNARVLLPNYRLAPEHACPAAIDDAVAIYLDLVARGTDPRQICVGGDSAGAGLTLALLHALRDGGHPLPASAMLLSPWTDLGVTGASAWTHDDDYLPTGQPLYDWAAMYVGDLSRGDPRVSPLFGDMAGLPPILLLIGGAEVFLDDGTRLAQKLTAAGVDVRTVIEPGEVHVYPMLPGFTPAADRGLEQMATFVEETVVKQLA